MFTVITEWSMWTHFEGVNENQTFADDFSRPSDTPFQKKTKKARFFNLKKKLKYVFSNTMGVGHWLQAFHCQLPQTWNCEALASPAMGHWGTCPLDLQQFNFSSALWPVQSLTATIRRQLPPVKTQQLLHVPLLAPDSGDATAAKTHHQEAGHFKLSTASNVKHGTAKTYHEEAGYDDTQHVHLWEVIHDVGQVKRWHGVDVISRGSRGRVLWRQHRLYHHHNTI